MFLSFALFEAIDATGRVESFLVFPTDAPTVVVDRLRDVRGGSECETVDLGALRFYADEASLKIRRLVAKYGPPAFQRWSSRIGLEIEHLSLPIADGTIGYYSLLLPSGFYGRVHASARNNLHWLADTQRLLVSGELLDHRGYRQDSLHVSADLQEGAEPDSHIPRIRSSEVYADWSSGPHHNNVRAFIRAANASLSAASPAAFICHSHEDRAFARRLAVALSGAGLRVWIDEAEIKVGESLIGKIERGISDSAHLVAIVSQASIASAWCREELRMALSRQIRSRHFSVLPVVIEDCELPGFLQEKKFADFREPHHFEEAMQELLAALKH